MPCLIRSGRTAAASKTCLPRLGGRERSTDLLGVLHDLGQPSAASRWHFRRIFVSWSEGVSAGHGQGAAMPAVARRVGFPSRGWADG